MRAQTGPAFPRGSLATCTSTPGDWDLQLTMVGHFRPLPGNPEDEQCRGKEARLEPITAWTAGTPGGGRLCSQQQGDK